MNRSYDLFSFTSSEIFGYFDDFIKEVEQKRINGFYIVVEFRNEYFSGSAS